MALSGNLGFVPLDEVLRLLTRADQTGAIDVRGQDVRGRIFMTRKGITLATTSDDQELRRHLINSGFLDEQSLGSVDTGSVTLGDIAERDSGLIDLLREMSVESLYQMDRNGSTFEVTEDETSPYASPRPFELESILESTKKRSDEWGEVQKVISDLNGVIKMNRDLGDRDHVDITREAWRLLCELGTGASVKTIAERLGTTEFWAAKVAAGMSEQQLLSLVETVVEQGYPEVEQGYVEPAPATSEYQVPEPVSQVETPPAAQMTETPEAEEDFDPNESWWVEPKAEEEEVEEPPVEEPAESRGGRFLGAFAARPAIQPEPLAGVGEQPEESAAPTADDTEVGEDTEAFLEKVFSTLEPNGGKPESEEDEDGGHGLLRRRRLGSVLKELSDED